MAVLSQSDLDQIKGAIQRTERKTSGEIVVLYQSASGAYAWVYFAWGALGIGIASVVTGTYSTFEWGLSALQMLEWQVLGLAFGLGASLFPPLRRLFLSKAHRAGKVHRNALAAFTNRGIFETRDRTGILICISEFEHLVEIIADKGIHQKLGESYWKKQAEAISASVKAKRAVDGVITAIEAMSQELEKFFPKRADDQNELPDDVT